MTESFDGKRVPIDSGLRVSGEYPYYGATGIIDYVDNYIFDGEYVLLAEDGANIIMRNYPIAYLTQGKFWLNNHAHIMRMIDGSNYFLVQMLEKIDYMKYNTGTAQPKLNSKIVKNIEFKLPHIEEQQKIGAFFKQIDDTIALHQRKVEALKEMKKGFLQQLFPQKGEKVPKVRFANFHDKWELRELRELVDVYDGTHQTPKYTNNGIMFLSVENIKTLQSEKYISKEAFEKDFKIRPEQGDVLMTRIGDIGTPNIIKSNEDIAYYVSLALLKQKDLDSYFLEASIQSPTVQIELWKRTLHIAFPKKINKNEIAKVPMHYPIYGEQQKMGLLFTKLDYTMVLHQKKIEQFKILKKAYLQNMFI